MNVARTISAFRRLRAKLPKPVGFVPTMGYLHEGHLSLVRRARASCPSVVASIFVNPSQFAPTEDLAAYPRDLERDVALLEKENVDLVLAPQDSHAFYPAGYCTWVDIEDLTSRLEGASRPTHFRGVATIVAKLFNVVDPDVVVFGQKDAQQALVIQRLIADLNFNIQLVLGPTIRESDGLAMSSRNSYLSPSEREAAPILYRSLQLAEHLYEDGVRDAQAIRQQMLDLIASKPEIKPEYISVANTENLMEVEAIEGKALVSLAARLGKTRLIDNCVLPPGHGLLGQLPYEPEGQSVRAEQAIDDTVLPPGESLP